MRQALKRLPPKEAYDRVFRIRRAVQVSSCRWVGRWHGGVLGTGRQAGS